MDITTRTQTTNETMKPDPAFQPVGSPWLLAATLLLGVALGWLLHGNLQGGDASKATKQAVVPPSAAPGN